MKRTELLQEIRKMRLEDAYCQREIWLFLIGVFESLDTVIGLA